MKHHADGDALSREVTHRTFPAMWSARELSFGGLAGRYKHHPRRCVRLMDPFTATLMEFSTPLQADNWLLRAFCPDVVSTQVPAKGLRYLHGGRQQTVPCHLVTTYTDGIQINDLVAKRKEDAEAIWPHFEKVSIAFNAVPKLRTAEEIRGNGVLLANLDRMCQHLTTHDLVDERRQDQVLAILPSNGEMPLKDLERALGEAVTEPELDSALFRLYRKGLVQINVVEVPYGPSSRISQA